MKQYIIKNEAGEIIGFEVQIGEDRFHFLRKIELKKADRKPGYFPRVKGDTREEVK